MFGNDRNQLRQYYIDVWTKAQTNQPLEPLEKIIADVIELHPEYQPILTDKDKALGKEYLPEMGETNPFMHMGMHIAIHEQLNANRPAGIREIYQKINVQFGDIHEAEHQIIECLAEVMWQAQRQGITPDESLYLNRLKQLIRK